MRRVLRWSIPVSALTLSLCLTPAARAGGFGFSGIGGGGGFGGGFTCTGGFCGGSSFGSFNSFNPCQFTGCIGSFGSPNPCQFTGCLGGFSGTTASPRQYYSGWTKHPDRSYYHRSYYFQLSATSTEYGHHYVIYYPNRPKYLYFYDPAKKQYY